MGSFFIVAKEFLLTVCIAMLPILELRGAIPMGLGYGLSYREAFCAAVIGNMIPVPFIMLFARKIFAWARKKSAKIKQFFNWLEKRAISKSKIIFKYKVIGLIILVAIPLPGTGAWTGALAATLLNLSMKAAVPAITAGVLIAGVIVTIISYGAGALFGF